MAEVEAAIVATVAAADATDTATIDPT
jgi:hypothetical protein